MRALLAFALLSAATLAAADVTVNIEYRPILQSSAKVADSPYMFGQLLTKDMKPIYTVDAAGKKTDKPLVSNEPDFSSLLTVGGRVTLVTHFEAPRPATQYVVQLNKANNGTLTPKSMMPVDWSSEHGLWIPCAGTVTPWQSHLAGEEYEPDARAMSEAKNFTHLKALYGGGWGDVEGFMKYFDLYPADLTMDNMKANFNPYRYGHIVEVKVKPDGTSSVNKWYTMGRAAWELATIMPDQKTLYGTDDGTNVGFFKFVADKKGDFSSGSLYAAKFTQTSAANGGAFDVEWILLGTGNNANLKALAEKTTFADIFETTAFNKTSKKCPDGFTSINAGAYGGPECLKLKAGQETAAAFFESRRYAAFMGATTEFSKWEGITLDSKRRKLYTSMTTVRYGMEDNKAKGKDSDKYDLGGANHVRLPYTMCGCVYELALDKAYSANKMSALICGVPNANTSDTANACDLNGISSPDNVSFMKGIDTLLIAEDTEYHQNGVLWAYDLNTKTLSRILSTPYGAEVTSAFYYPNIKAASYIVAVVQHPYEAAEDKATEPDSSGTDAWVGYFTWKASAMSGAKSATWAAIPPSQTNKEKHSVRFATKVTFKK